MKALMPSKFFAGPMHVAVTYQREMGVDAFGRECLAQRLINGHVFHRRAVLLRDWPEG